MQAIFTVSFRDKNNPSRETDSRKICRPASLAGFKSVMLWAENHCEKWEIVGSITMTEVERS